MDKKRTGKTPDKAAEKKAKTEPNVVTELKNKLLKHVKAHKKWSAFWLDAIDTPQKAVADANVTVLVLTNGASGSRSSFGFLMASSRKQMKKDRQNDCLRDILCQVEQLVNGKCQDDLRAWCQVPEDSRDAADQAKQSEAIAKLKDAITTRLAAIQAQANGKASVPQLELSAPNSQSSVIVASSALKADEVEEAADLTAMDFFEADSAALLTEACRVNGLVRQRWYLATVKATRKDSDKFRQLNIGVGFATDEAMAKARALQAAQIRAEVVSEAMFLKPAQT